MFINFSVFGREVFSINVDRTDVSALLAELGVASADSPDGDEPDTPFGFAPGIDT